MNVYTLPVELEVELAAEAKADPNEPLEEIVLTSCVTTRAVSRVTSIAVSGPCVTVTDTGAESNRSDIY